MRVYRIANFEQILCFLREIESFFEPPLSERLDLEEYAYKLFTKAKVLCIQDGDRIVSAMFFYVNEHTLTAYIPVLGTVSDFSGQGIMKTLMDEAEDYLLAKNYVSVGLETWLGSKALNIYIKRGYHVTSISKPSDANRTTVTLSKDLRKSFPTYSFIETPIELNDRLNNDLGVNVYFKRDDIFPVIGGGSKARKLKYILRKAIENGCTAVVTAGSNSSNHLRATAVLCAELGLKFTACIHDTRPSDSEIRGNLKLTVDLCQRHIFVEMHEIKQVMDNAINAYMSEGEKPLYIWGGGHCVEGTFSYYHATQSAIGEINVVPDYMFLASGTGTTQAGIVLGAAETAKQTKVIGISIARSKDRGREAIEEAIEAMKKYLPGSRYDSAEVIFDDSFLAGGYGQSEKKLDDFIKFIRREYGLILDPVYSGKAFYGLWNYVKSGKIKKGQNILFWNTGGVLNMV